MCPHQDPDLCWCMEICSKAVMFNAFHVHIFQGINAQINTLHTVILNQSSSVSIKSGFNLKKVDKVYV